MADDQLGTAVDIEGDVVIISSPDDDGGASYSGATFVFVLDGPSWSEYTRLLSPHATAFDKAGISAAVSGDRVLTGVPYDNVPLTDAGGVDVFVLGLEPVDVLRYVHSDHLGSSSLSTDASGAEAGMQTYMPWGEVRSATGSLGTGRGFTGQRFDTGTGLSFYSARYYYSGDTDDRAASCRAYRHSLRCLRSSWSRDTSANRSEAPTSEGLHFVVHLRWLQSDRLALA